jgi:murein DD-endopeptidase MepM/ murein hydrolase activator NlpD
VASTTASTWPRRSEHPSSPPRTGYGNAVYIEDTEGFVHVYGHMRYWNVEAGQVVRAGEQIAKVGNEGRSTGPHLHWEVRLDDMHGRPLDPQEWLLERGIDI